MLQDPVYCAIKVNTRVGAFKNGFKFQYTSGEVVFKVLLIANVREYCFKYRPCNTK